MFTTWMLGAGLGCLFIPPPGDSGKALDSGTVADESGVPSDDSGPPDDTGAPSDDTGEAPTDDTSEPGDDPCLIDVTGLAVLAVKDPESSETTPGRALWVCADAYVEVMSDANLVIVDRDGAALLKGPDNQVAAFSNAMVATQGTGNALVREQHTIAKGDWASVHECAGGIRVERDGQEAVSPCP